MKYLLLIFIILFSTFVNAIPIEYTIYGFGPSEIIKIGGDKIDKRISAPGDSVITGVGVGYTEAGEGSSIDNAAIWYKPIGSGGLGTEIFSKTNDKDIDLFVASQDSFINDVSNTDNNLNNFKIPESKYILSRLSFMACKVLEFFYQPIDEQNNFKEEISGSIQGSDAKGDCAQNEKATKFPQGKVIRGVGFGLEIR
ncbi:hypothetical protein HY498_00335 [Candidatus Woesearchaeota archaeon]|nr:hypothetical protein [Candidatus Woesearchaeota archaeon]